MTITVYRSTDVSAPVLNGTAGSFIAVLDACLVNGYGSKSAAGWTKEYSETNLAAYRMSTTSPATGMYLRVDDTSAQNARLVGYETMSDVNTGTGPFPTNAQVSGGLYYYKSSSANSDARSWMIVATNRSFYFFSSISATTVFSTVPANNQRGMFFGDIISRKTSDEFNCMIISTGSGSGPGVLSNISAGTSNLTGHYIARSYTQTGESIAVSKTRVYGGIIFAGGSLGVSSASSSAIRPAGDLPNSITDSIEFAKVTVAQSATEIRGYLPGFYEIIGGSRFPCEVGYEFQGVGSMMLVVPASSTDTANCGFCAVQLSNSWYE